MLTSFRYTMTPPTNLSSAYVNSACKFLTPENTLCRAISPPPPNTAKNATTATTRSSYYNADTADLEIGQEFEDAEAEEEAALELQRASYKRLDPADYGEEEEEEEGEAEENEKGKKKKKTGEKRRATEQGAALLAMKSDLEQIALGAGGEVCGRYVGVGRCFRCAGVRPLRLTTLPLFRGRMHAPRAS